MHIDTYTHTQTHTHTHSLIASTYLDPLYRNYACSSLEELSIKLKCHFCTIGYDGNMQNVQVPLPNSLHRKKHVHRLENYKIIIIESTMINLKE